MLSFTSLEAAPMTLKKIVNQTINKRLEILEALFKSARYDYEDIKMFSLNRELFANIQKSRVITSSLCFLTFCII
jgi:hypothetical protein